MADIAASGNFTPAELLAEVNKAIQAVLVGGQSYKIGSRSLTRADLNLLLATRNDLTAQIAAEEDMASSRIPTSHFLMGGDRDGMA